MAVNQYFQQYSYAPEQRLYENIVEENIKIHGIDVKYLPKTIVNQDFILGEDPLMRYDLAVDIEVYVKDFAGFQGQGDFLSKFNLEVRDELTLIMSKRRWNEIATEKLVDEVGYNYQEESANSYTYGESFSYVLEDGSANGYSITSPRPMEGDVIYLPLNNKLYEITFVEHENPFYQQGKLYTYEVKCSLFDRDSRLRTGNTAIDTIETTYTQDVLFNQYLTEDGDALTSEDGGHYITEFRLEVTVPTANNEAFTQESHNVVDFSEMNPLINIDGNLTPFDPATSEETETVWDENGNFMGWE